MIMEIDECEMLCHSWNVFYFFYFFLGIRIFMNEMNEDFGEKKKEKSSVQFFFCFQTRTIYSTKSKRI